MATGGNRVRLVGADRTIRRLQELAAKDRQAAERAVADETEAVADDMRKNAAVGDRRRGERGRPPLVESIEAEASGLSGEARATARHSHIVEEGTRSHRAQPFAGPAAQRGRRRFGRRVADEIREENQSL